MALLILTTLGAFLSSVYGGRLWTGILFVGVMLAFVVWSMRVILRIPNARRARHPFVAMVHVTLTGLWSSVALLRVVDRPGDALAWLWLSLGLAATWLASLEARRRWAEERRSNEPSPTHREGERSD